MTEQTTQQWQPIEQLPLIVSHIDGMLESANEQHETLQLVRPKPFVLDNDTVGRAHRCVVTDRPIAAAHVPTGKRTWTITR